MKKSTFFTIEVNAKLSVADITEIERAINKVLPQGETAVASNMQYKKAAYFEGVF